MAPICRCARFDNAYSCIHRLCQLKLNSAQDIPSLTVKHFVNGIRIFFDPKCILPHSGSSFASYLVSCRSRYAKLVKGIEEEQAECIVANATALLVLQSQVKVEIRLRERCFEFWCPVLCSAVRIRQAS